MNELTIILDTWLHKELKDYLQSLNGVHEVNIINEIKLSIHIKYDANLINYKMLKMEILLFLDKLKVPSIIAFDKHSNNKRKESQIIINDLCCEFCLKGMIEDLFMLEGIEKVDSN